MAPFLREGGHGAPGPWLGGRVASGLVDPNTGYIARGLVPVSLLLSGFVAFGLAAVIPDWLAIVLAFALVGPCVHGVVGTTMNRRPERWGGTGNAIVTTGIAYPLVVWLGGTFFAVTSRSIATAALFFVGFVAVPLVIVVVVVLVWDPDRRARQAAARERQAIATERGWQFIADGTEVLGDHWATRGEAPQVTATSVLAGDIDGWPVTICDTVARGRGRIPDNRTVTCLVHLPVSLPHTVALPAYSVIFENFAHGQPWTAAEYTGELTAENLYLACSDDGFADRLATPDLCRFTIDRGLMFWRIKGRDLSLSRQTQGRHIPTEDALRTASNLVALAHALPTDLIDAYGAPPHQSLPFRETSPHHGPDGAPPDLQDTP